MERGHVQFLLEVMIAYGLTYPEYLELKVRERDAAAAQAVQERTELLRRWPTRCAPP